MRCLIKPDATQVNAGAGHQLHRDRTVQQRQFPGWGLLFDKQEIFNRGGGPVWYARPDQAGAAAGTPAAEWIVSYDTRTGARSDWTHEQEWRLHAHCCSRGRAPVRAPSGPYRCDQRTRAPTGKTFSASAGRLRDLPPPRYSRVRRRSAVQVARAADVLRR
jgi:hypothetical protein